MTVDYRPLREGLLAYKKHWEDTHDGKVYGAWKALQRKTRVHSSAMPRYIRGEITPEMDSWEKLHRGCPEFIPAPTITVTGSVSRSVEDVGLVRIPVFDAGAGEPSSFTDGGYPVGHSSNTVLLHSDDVDEETFAVKIHGQSMAPYLNEGDVVIIVPSAQLENGKLCFASWPDDNGQRLVKRYYRYGETIVLRSDNPDKETYPDIEISHKNHRRVRIFRVTSSQRKE